MENHLLSDFLREQSQKLWNRLFLFALYKMNIGGGGSIEESGELLLLKNILMENKRSTSVIFDVGANVGNYAKQILSINPLVDLYCFEPSGQTFETLRGNLSGYAKNIKLFNVGLGQNNGCLTLYSDKEISGLASVYKRRLNHANIHMDNEETVEIKTLDSFCSEHAINKIDLLKLDVEGHELSVLHGASTMLEHKKINYIQFEFGGCNIDSRTYFQDFYYLLSPDFKIYRILRNGLFQIENYSELNEIFTTTNYLAVSKKIDQPE